MIGISTATGRFASIDAVMSGSTRRICWFDELGLADVARVGGKNASLGEMVCHLENAGVRVPGGFATTAAAFREAMDAAGAGAALSEALSGLDVGDTRALAACGRRCREVVYRAGLGPALEEVVTEGYRRLEARYGEHVSVAVRSSATAEDLPGASFAGQHDSYLNVSGAGAVLEACRRCFASLFTDRAIRYRADRGFDHLKVMQSVGVMKMVRADLAASGVIFTLDTESGHRDVVFVTAAYGLGENVVQGAVDPDEFHVHKPALARGFRAVLRRALGEKKVRMVCGHGRGGAATRNVATPRTWRDRYCIGDEEVLQLAECALRIEAHYSEHAGSPTPMDIEWGKDGEDGELYILQARPETVASRQSPTQLTEHRLTGSGQVAVVGRAVGNRVACGPVRVVHEPRDLGAFRDGEVLVADSTTPDWGTVMRRAAAIVTNRGGRTCHAAIVARELGIPAVVGTGDVTERVHDGETVTVSCAGGATGQVYRGEVPFETVAIDLRDVPATRTEVMVNLGDPEQAFQTARLPCAGVGLARMEFIITEQVKAHPMALLHPERVDDPQVRAELLHLARHDASPAAFFVRTLSEGVGTIAAAFWPRPVIVRLSDFKTNEYATLLGGTAFEPHEENPMLGFRGASRYAHEAYAGGFELECRALARVRGEMGLDNLRVMVPFCRRLEEADRVLAAMAGAGLARGADGLQVYVMCEIPNNVILVDEFAQRFDGFSIGSNDLTQLTLGVDRDSQAVAFDFDERDPGVLAFIAQAIAGARRNARHVGICGQAPSDYPEVAEFLVREGIDSISVTPDRVIGTIRLVARIEGERASWDAPPAAGGAAAVPRTSG